MDLKHILSFIILILNANLFFGQVAYVDNFINVAYNNNDGTQNFSTNWIEENDDNNAAGGNIQVYGPFQQLLFYQLPNANRRLRRSLDLSAATTVKLALTYDANNRGNESLAVQLWNNATAQWNTVFNINQTNSNRISITLTADQISANSQIRFESTSGGWNSNEYILIDDIIVYSYDDAIPTNVPLVLVDQFNGNFDYSVTGGTLRDEIVTGDPCTIITNSSNQLTSTVTAGATIEKAILYWSHSSFTPDTEVIFEGQNVNADMVYASDVIPGRVFYGYESDVTSIVQGVSNINTNTFDFTGLDISTNDIYCNTSTVLGGWSLMIFFDDPLITASSINLYQGFDGFSNAGTSFTLDSFFAIGGAGAKATFLSWEGDSGLDGASPGSTNPEELSITNQAGTNFILQNDGGTTTPEGNDGNNAYNSTIYDETTGVNQINVHGLDLDTYDISGFIATSNNQVTANVDVGQDFIVSNAVVLKVPSNLIGGSVFEDVNYGGGTGRNQLASAGVPVVGATVEIYDNLGNLWDTVLTDANGDYTFGGMANGSYSIRVVNQTVRSSRGGGVGCTTCYGIQTYRRFYDGTSYIEVTSEVGGNNPSANGDSNSGTLNGAQSVSQVNITASGITGIDFGFNFNTIVNTNDDGQGSLEQFIVNSNNLDETGLDIDANSIFNPAPGEDTSIFMIPPTGDTYGRTADTNYANGYFNISVPNGNPFTAITGNNTKIDGRTQTAYSGNTNMGTVGAGGSNVGTSAIALPNYDRPEIQVYRPGGDVLRVNAFNATIRNTAVYANNNAGIVSNGGSLNIVNNLLGVNALGANAGNIDSAIEITSGDVIVDGNYIDDNTDQGIWIRGGSSVLIQNNDISNNGTAACNDNILIEGGNNITIQRNLINNAASFGIDLDGVAGNIVINENTITNSGQDGGGCGGTLQNAGINITGDNSSITNNIIASNGGAGIIISGGNSSGNLISQNSIFANGTAGAALGIDINNDGVTINDSADADTGPNNSENFPIISGAFITGNSLEVKGWAAPGTVVEVFFTDINQGSATVGDNSLGLTQDYGEGQVYIGTGIEGSVNDQDTSASPYLDNDGNTDNTNRFKFTFTLPLGTVLGNNVTATGTRANTTSEFSPQVELTAYSVITNRRITYRIKTN